MREQASLWHWVGLGCWFALLLLLGFFVLWVTWGTPDFWPAAKLFVPMMIGALICYGFLFLSDIKEYRQAHVHDRRWRSHIPHIMACALAAMFFFGLIFWWPAG